MDALLYHFPVSGVETWVWLPPLIMFLIASATSMGGVTGAFILLPFNMSVLGYTSPGVSATNFVYNIVAIPLGVWRHIRSARMSWALLAVLAVGTLPGVFLGYVIRITWLPSPRVFKPFVGVVLTYLAVRMFQSVWRDHRQRRAAAPGAGVGASGASPGDGGPDSAGAKAKDPGAVSDGRITRSRVSLREIVTEVGPHRYRCAVAPVFVLSLVVGVVGGAYGIGGGAVMAPFCIAVMGLPPFVVAGASLLSTWITSVVGALIYAFGPLSGSEGASPDWLLGILYGVGGMAGVYLGARLQGRVPAAAVKGVLGLALLFVAARYLLIPVVTWLLG